MKVIAFYLPQFHRVPENDLWWGEGFTEWTNTRKAKPLFSGHEQPRTPLGGNYYDLTDPLAQEWQAKLASDHGIHAFCYYHYWFKGRRILEKPLNQVINSGKPNFPFCVAWANQSWTRTWDGDDREVLIAQEYGDYTDWDAHISYLLTLFKDSRYVKINDCPMLLIYMPSSIPRLNEMLALWRKRVREAGFLDIHLVGMKTVYGGADAAYDFDRWVDFEPLYTWGHDLPVAYKITRKLRAVANRIVPSIHPPRGNYDFLWKRILERADTSKNYLGGFVNWDNSARKGIKALIIVGYTPRKFANYIQMLIAKAKQRDDDYIFINAWNEWAEGTYLEPDERYGMASLEAIKSAVSQLR